MVPAGDSLTFELRVQDQVLDKASKLPQRVLRFKIHALRANAREL